jgi:hypothetical protein
MRNKARKWVLEALQHVFAVFPFPVMGIDSDYGSEFINEHLFNYRTAVGNDTWKNIAACATGQPSSTISLPIRRR